MYLNLIHLNSTGFRRFYLQLNIRERNPVVKRDPTILIISNFDKDCAVRMEPYGGLLHMWY
jgi:hypothetical protein